MFGSVDNVGGVDPEEVAWADAAFGIVDLSGVGDDHSNLLSDVLDDEIVGRNVF